MKSGSPPSSFIIPTSSFRAAHERLYRHLSATTPDKPDATLEDLQPLYQAVAHGCQAGLQQEALYKVYHARLQRRDERYSTFKLGALGSDLGAIACFFETPWNRISPALKEAEQAWMLNEAAFRLRALGRLTESLDPMRVSGEMDVKVEQWDGAARSYSNLSGLDLTLGEVAGAVGDASRSVTYADRSGDADMRMITRTTHADALHQAGRGAEAEALFREAEQMQAESQPVYPLLYSLRGFKYCDLLLAAAERAAWRVDLASGGCQPAGTTPRADRTRNGPVGSRPPLAEAQESCRDVSQRATQTLMWAEQNTVSLLDIALDHLTLGRAALYGAVLSSDSAALSSFLLPTSHLQPSVSDFRRAGAVEFLVRGLLIRAWLRSLTSARTGPDSAQSDLDEAWEIAARGPMPLFMAEIHLYRARLLGRPAVGASGSAGRPATTAYPWESVEHDLAEARRLIEKHGYGRRMGELEDAENALQKSGGP